MDTATKTQTVTITAGDIRKCAQYTVEDIAAVYLAYGHAMGFDKARLARDIGLIYMGEWAEQVMVELYDATHTARGRHIYRPKADANARHHEPGSFKKLDLPKGLRVRITVVPNPAKSAGDVEAFFREIGWGFTEALKESGRGKLERDGGFRSGGFNVDRWVYYDTDEQGQTGGYIR